MALSSRITRKRAQSSRAVAVQCVQCGKTVPRDKAIEKRKSTLPLNPRLREELKKQDARLPSHRSLVYYRISCAKHRRYV